MTDAPPTPSLLQLRRRLAVLELKLRGQAGAPALSVGLTPTGHATSAPELRALGFLAERAHEVLVALAGDKVGREALRDKVQRIQLRVDERSSVAFSNNTLELVIGRRPVSWYTRKELEQDIQSAL